MHKIKFLIRNLYAYSVYLSNLGSFSVIIHYNLFFATEFNSDVGFVIGRQDNILVPLNFVACFKFHCL